ncbi:MAG: hypothetical protein JWR66_2751 [Modestobacter sp.]|nr:hypothetical protein [Modestobacter sp.]
MTTTGARPDAGADRRPQDVRAADGRRPDVPERDALPVEELGARDALPRVLKVVGAIVAPTSLLTGLLFYFGRSRGAGYYRYFHVNATVLDLSTNDVLVAGVDGLFVPISVACSLALVALWLNRLLLTRMPDGARRRVLRVLVPAAGTVGAGLMTLAFVDLFTDGAVLGVNSPTGGLGLALGVVLSLYAVRLVRLESPVAGRRPAGGGLAEWAAAFLLVSIGLFWAAGGYAFGVGTGGASTLHRALPGVPEAVLYSERSLSLVVPGVTEVRCADPDAAYRFRYDGLRLVRRAGDQYLLLPATWNRDTGVAVLISRGAGIRLEFAAPGQVREGAC